MKRLFFFIVMFLLIVPISVRADDHIYSIDMNIHVEQDGYAHITEVWNVQADGGTEWCKRFSNLENTEIKNISVSKDDKALEYKENWGTSDSLKSKAGYYGINYTAGGMEICFGKTDMERHSFMINYGIPNYVITTGDSQLLYHVLSSDVTADAFYADIITYYGMPDNLELWGFGYEGSSYVDGGRIVLSNYDGLKDQYVTVLAKFPLDTFDSKKNVNGFVDFNDVYSHAENAEYEYKDYSKRVSRFTFLDFIFVLLSIFVVILIIEFIVRHVTGKSILKQEKVEKILIKIKPFYDKTLGKVLVIFKNLFSKIKDLIKKVVLFIKNKISKK